MNARDRFTVRPGPIFAMKRLEAGRTLRDLEIITGVDAEKIGGFEEGEDTLSAYELFMLAAALGITVDDLTARAIH